MLFLVDLRIRKKHKKKWYYFLYTNLGSKGFGEVDQQLNLQTMSLIHSSYFLHTTLNIVASSIRIFNTIKEIKCA